MSPGYRTSIRLVAPALAAALALTACSSGHDSRADSTRLPDGEVRIPTDAPQRAYITVTPATPSTEHVVATLPAQIAPDEDHTVRISSPVAGRAVSVLVRPGDVVAAGQALATIRSADAAQAGSDAARALASWNNARASLARVEDLYAHQIAAAHDLEQARSDEAQARAEYGRARARAGQLGVGGSTVSDLFVLRAPIAGVVLDRGVSAGAEVRPDAAAPLFTVSAVRSVWLTVGVPQRDLPAVHRGTRLRFTTDAVPGREFVAPVNYVGDALDPVTHTAIARASLANDDGALRILTSGQASIVTSESEPFVVVPTRSLVTHGSATVVFVEVSPGRFLRRTVVVRDDDGTRATLTSGVSAGEHVVANGSLLLESAASMVR